MHRRRTEKEGNKEKWKVEREYREKYRKIRENVTRRFIAVADGTGDCNPLTASCWLSVFTPRWDSWLRSVPMVLKRCMRLQLINYILLVEIRWYIVTIPTSSYGVHS
jgi:hypothetical protein